VTVIGAEEVLDPEQNNASAITTWMCRSIFRRCVHRHGELDGSHPRALRDRMEIIDCRLHRRGETHIAHKYLIPKQPPKRHKSGDRSIHDEGLREIIHSFTREAGVRTWSARSPRSRETGAAHREGKMESGRDTGSGSRIPGRAEIPHGKGSRGARQRPALPSDSSGRRWEATSSSSSDPHARRQAVHHDRTFGRSHAGIDDAALTWTRANGERYGIDPDFFRKQDIHIHVPSARCQRTARPPVRRWSRRWSACSAGAR